MFQKKALRFIKKYLLGLAMAYFIIFILAFIFIKRTDKINSNNVIPTHKIENQFGLLKSFKDYKGKVLLVDFWFQGCQPCLDEMRYFPDLLQKYKSKLAIMSISIDSKEATKYLLKEKPEPWSFLISDNKDWTFYNDDRINDSYVKELNVLEYPTYLLFNEEGELISTPFSGIAGVEIELSTVFGLDLTFKAHKEIFEKLPFLVIPYTLLVVLLLFIQYLIFIFKKILNRKRNNL